MDRIIAAMPSGNANLVNPKSLYVAISRVRDRADLVTDDPKRLADQVERATGERIAALDVVAEQAVLADTQVGDAVDGRQALLLVTGDRVSEIVRGGPPGVPLAATRKGLSIWASSCSNS